MSQIIVVRDPTSRETLGSYTLDGEMVKAVVDVAQQVMAIGGSLHADEEQMLLEAGARQQDLWGVNLHLDGPADAWVEFDSMINLRPSQGNRSRGVDDPALQEKILTIVKRLVPS